ncbi:response regulator [Leptolyngbya sp. FACHB-711]|uniref:response regulator n=1 Tax=unclassified Leptolyngbya TaxID=2650499 RepID=UPI00168748A8|nr:response regulator [Leptolyngbya sp. FACHB-711]MBD1851344.1 response regulator [Cyanobacteria bacterium FACHB-502]MBD2027575.1 response regulator [Leptolyngbya sp. FACHB-711]
MNPPLVHSDVGVPKILIVDDISDNSFLLQTFLETEGYQVDVADNGHAALEKIEAEPPALILLDMMMPGMNGFEVSRRIRQNKALPYIPILLITGFDQPSEAEEQELGINGFIRKPVDFTELINQVRSLLPKA